MIFSWRSLRTQIRYSTGSIEQSAYGELRALSTSSGTLYCSKNDEVKLCVGCDINMFRFRGLRLFSKARSSGPRLKVRSLMNLAVFIIARWEYFTTVSVCAACNRAITNITLHNDVSRASQPNRLIQRTILEFESKVALTRYLICAGLRGASRRINVRKHRLATTAYFQCVEDDCAILRIISVC